MKLFGYVTQYIRMYVQGNKVKYVCKKHTKQYITDITTLRSILANANNSISGYKWRNTKDYIALILQYK